MTMLLTGSGPDIVVVATTTTWNPADASAKITLTGGNLIATANAADAVGSAVRAVRSQTSGLRYAEFTATLVNAPTGNMSVGIANATAPITGAILGGDVNSVGYYDNGTVYLNLVVVATLATYVTGNVISMAVNSARTKIWFRVNAGGWNNDILANQNPATDVGGISITAITGPLFPATSLTNLNEAVTANFGATAYAQSVPTGGTNW